MFHNHQEGRLDPQFGDMVDPPGGGRPYAPKTRAHEDPRFHSPELLQRFFDQRGIFQKMDTVAVIVIVVIIILLVSRRPL